MNNVSPKEIEQVDPGLTGTAILARWLQPARIRTLLALFDQMIVSGTSFVLTVAVGRLCGREGLGLYTLGFSVVVFAVGIQAALVSTPYTVYFTRRDPEVDPRKHAGNSAAAAVILTVLITLLSIIATLTLELTSYLDAFLPVAWALCGTLPLFMLRDFARRFDFAQMNMLGAVAVDVSVMVLTLLGIYSLANMNWLTPQSVFIAGGASCAATVIFWAARRLLRSEFRFSPREVPNELRRDWKFGRWVLVDRIICVAHLYILHWLLAGFVSTEATGVLAACGSVAALSSPFVQGMGNFLSPHFAHRVTTGGRAQTLSLFWKSTGILVSALFVFAVVATIFAEPLLWYLYKDPSYAGYGYLVGLLALRAVLVAPHLAAHHAVLALESPRASAWSSMMGFSTTVMTAIILIPTFEINGAVCAAIVGTAVEAVAMCAFFVKTLRRWDWHTT